MIYVLIKNGVVTNSIVADPNFIHDYAKDSNVDLVLEYNDEDWHPGPGWIYLGNNQFQAPVLPEEENNDNGN